MPLQYSSVFCMSLHVSCARHRLHFSARLSTEPLPAPTSAAGHKVYPPKIEALVKDITHLTLLETSQLNELLKVGWDCCCVLTFSWREHAVVVAGIGSTCTIFSTSRC